jgi:two-component system OmpR family response regulator
MRILLIEDDPVLGDALLRSLRQAGYAVDWVNDGLDADHMLISSHCDLVILDLSLPRMDGLEILRRLRLRGSTVPVLILTARDALESRVNGLDFGADDYLTKPFDLRELEARARALIRRGLSGMSAQLKCGTLTFDTAGRQASLPGMTLDLSARELCVLETLMLRAGKVVSKDLLGEQLAASDEELSSNAIEVYVHRLRKKLEGADVTIRTLRGLGYLLEKQ